MNVYTKIKCNMDIVDVAPYHKDHSPYPQVLWKVQDTQLKNKIDFNLDVAFKKARKDLLCVRK